jgi:GNAT superfamily N-acetyltransferase
VTIVRVSARPLGTLHHTRALGWTFTGDPFVGCAVSLVGHQDGSVGEAARVQFVMNGRTLMDKGTYVAPAFRRSGLALQLWREAITWKRPTGVTAACLTAAGMRLVLALQREHPQLDWKVFDEREVA